MSCFRKKVVWGLHMPLTWCLGRGNACRVPPTSISRPSLTRSLWAPVQGSRRHYICCSENLINSTCCKCAPPAWHCRRRSNADVLPSPLMSVTSLPFKSIAPRSESSTIQWWFVWALRINKSLCIYRSHRGFMRLACLLESTSQMNRSVHSVGVLSWKAYVPDKIA